MKHSFISKINDYVISRKHAILKKYYSYLSLNHLSIYLRKIEKMIESNKYKVISFDIFDTLLVRSVIEPNDIFSILDKTSNFNYSKYRSCAENFSKPYSSIEDIWECIQKKNKLSNAEKELNMNKEIELEKKLIYKRELIYNLYKKAVQSGKRIIVISDMYLPKKILKELLIQNGYDAISDIYVSCECKQLKAAGGGLFRFVIEAEKVNPSEIIHIGDNFWSDYINPKENKIKSIWLPSNKDLFLSKFKIELPQNIDSRLLAGYLINCLFEETSILSSKYLDLKNISVITMMPILICIIANINKIYLENSYNKIYYASRDGFLIDKFFEECNNFDKNRSKYFYFSRLSTFLIFLSSPYDFEKIKGLQMFTIESFIRSIILDSEEYEKVISKLTKEDLEYCLAKDKQKAERILRKLEPSLSNFFYKRKKNIEIYFNELFNAEKERIIVYDSGYSGSISVSISEIVKNKFKVDKIYLWQNESNKDIDRKFETKTFSIFGDVENAKWYPYFYEIMLSSCDGTCIGYVDDDSNVKEKINITGEPLGMRIDKNYIQDIALSKTIRFFDILGDKCDKFLLNDLKFFFNLIDKCFGPTKKNYSSLKNICYYDDYFKTKHNVTDLIFYYNKEAIIAKQKNILFKFLYRLYYKLQ